MTPKFPIKAVIESSERSIGTVPVDLVNSGGDSGRPLTLRNVKEPQKFSLKGQTAASMWLTKISCWIHLLKALESDLYNVVATRMSSSVLTLINTTLNLIQESGVASRPIWKGFARAINAKSEMLSREERTRE